MKKYIVLTLVIALIGFFNSIAKDNIPNPNNSNTDSYRLLSSGCLPSTAQTIMDINNVRTTILGGGDIDPVLTITAIQDGTDLIDDSTECVDNVAYITEEPLITPNPLSPSGKLGNIGDVNFISSGCASDYVIAYSTIDSGHNITQRSRSSRRCLLRASAIALQNGEPHGLKPSLL